MQTVFDFVETWVICVGHSKAVRESRLALLKDVEASFKVDAHEFDPCVFGFRFLFLSVAVL